MYLPLASGMLRAYAESYSYVRAVYKFMPFIFKRDTVDNIVSQHNNPSIACFSVSIWNYNLSIAVAKRLKEIYPRCLIVFGGPSVPKGEEYPIDHIIHGQGEAAFAALLLGRKVLLKDINDFPSPYTTGLFDYLLKDGTNYQAIIETNRGCHNGCYYCFWGNGEKKYKFFHLNKVREEANWIGRNKIKYVFCSDSNFGTFSRDIDIAQIYADTKAKHGYPEKFRVCYGKSDKDSIFKSARTLSKARLAKAVTMSRQTNNYAAAMNVGRKNIKREVFDKLQAKYEAAGILTYSEFILGLPGETIASFRLGIYNAFKTKTKLFIYHCTVLPNTEMEKPEYQKKYGIKTARVPITEIHCTPNTSDVTEYEDIIIETNTMSKEEWIDATVYSWKIQLLKLGVKNIPQSIDDEFYKTARLITLGESRGQLDLKFGNIIWEPEELAYLRIMYKDGDPIEFAKQEILYGRKGR